MSLSPAHRGFSIAWALLVAAWLAGSVLWLSWDRVVRDGDEEGHVGAAELFEVELADGDVSAAAERLWAGQTGEYPGLFPAAVGAWWAAWGGGQPGRVPVRAGLLLSLLVAAVAARRLAADAAPDQPWAPLGAGAATLLLPMANGLSRHFMPEGALVAAVAVAALAGSRAAARPDAGRALAFGVALGAGMLVKQTFALYALAPAAWALWRLGRHRWLALSAAGLIAGPWYLSHLNAQLAYSTGSAAALGPSSLLQKLLYYPVVAAWEGLGPPLLLAAVAAVWALARQAAGRRALWVPGLWLVGGGLLLVAVPKKYPRLLAPLTPAAAVVMGVALAGARRPARVFAGVGLASAAWVIGASARTIPAPSLVDDLDPGCTQRWLRAPQPDDLGMLAVTQAVAAAAPGPVVVLGGPAIPCDVATTHPWIEHLGPSLRRAGLERPVVAAEGAGTVGTVVVDWTGGGGQRVAVPALQRTFTLRVTPGPMR